jgi:hypothetical protein
MQIADRMTKRGRPVIVVNQHESAFTEHALVSGGADIRGKATELVPLIVERLIA